MTSDFTLTLFEACEFLGRSQKSISRYIKRGLLHPEQVRSKQGTLEYRFSRADLEALKARERQGITPAKQTRPDKPPETGQRKPKQPRQDTLLSVITEQLKIKDDHIKDLSGKIDQLIERDRETNILIGQLQSKVLLLEPPKGKRTEQTRQDTGDTTGQGWWQKLFKRL